MELNRVCSDCGTSLDRRGRLFCSVACKKRASRRLLRLGVTPLTSADDVLEALGIVPPEPARPEVGEVASWLLERVPASADELVRASALTAGEVAAALAELEIAQLVAEAKASTAPNRAKPNPNRARR